MIPFTASTPAAPPFAPPAIPLTADLRAAYENLSAKYQAAFLANPDYAFRLQVHDWKTDVDDILEKDARYRLDANTALLQALLEQIESTNVDLAKIKVQITAVAADFALAGDVLSAINTVLTLLPV